jgi:hypothetical protein
MACSTRALIVCIGATLSACEGVPVIAEIATVQGMALNHTDKIATDHLISAITGQDCNLLTYKKFGKYCRSAAEIAAERARLANINYGHCYRTRGLVTCFAEPEVMETGETRTF